MQRRDLLCLTYEDGHDIAPSVQHFEQDCASILLCPLNCKEQVYCQHKRQDAPAAASSGFLASLHFRLDIFREVEVTACVSPTCILRCCSLQIRRTTNGASASTQKLKARQLGIQASMPGTGHRTALPAVNGQCRCLHCLDCMRQTGRSSQHAGLRRDSV